MKIICFGDSLTRGVSFVKGRLRIIRRNYPHYLEETLLSSGKPPRTVINKGVFNDDSDSLLKRLEKDVLEEEPDYAIIGIGGNDCNFDWKEVTKNPEAEHLPIVPLSRYLSNVNMMISRLQEAGITPIILTLPPLDPVRYYYYLYNQYGSSIGHLISLKGGMEYWHGMYNLRLIELAQERKAAVIDVRTALYQAGPLSELISEDGIHLTSAGYKVVGREIAKFFNGNPQ
ncbi:SGNH/GDSL hydrolase family protein [Metabacillus sp. 84]|uniref:SGNH/GDSL hydrolase family protein n=1 Tax=unclassified Metabacillus TaxID=2675274 RepID=UPI003CF2B568